MTAVALIPALAETSGESAERGRAVTDAAAIFGSALSLAGRALEDRDGPPRIPVIETPGDPEDGTGEGADATTDALPVPVPLLIARVETRTADPSSTPDAAPLDAAPPATASSAPVPSQTDGADVVLDVPLAASAAPRTAQASVPPETSAQQPGGAGEPEAAGRGPAVAPASPAATPESAPRGTRTPERPEASHVRVIPSGPRGADPASASPHPTEESGPLPSRTTGPAVPVATAPPGPAVQSAATPVDRPQAPSASAAGAGAAPRSRIHH
ncbi:hypothetical protein [Microbacterium sp. 179-I 3D4 NHS]|uniref:hypothetical protein n=1 Tax=Microbacterium sp. 179-I 3D4 NHS TaxID=3142381 RepID=UPI0039A1BB1B